MAEDQLFDGGPAPKPEKKPKAPPKPKPEPKAGDGAVKRCIDAFYAGYVRKWNPLATPETPKRQLVTPLIHGAKHGAQLKQLVASWDEAVVLDLIALFFETRDPQVTRSDYSLDAFVRLAQYLRLARVRSAPTNERTAANLDAARRATGRRTDG